MQEAEAFPIDITFNCEENILEKHSLAVNPGERIFFRGDLGAGKSTYIRMIIRKHLKNPSLIIRSPTYNYFHKYGDNIYHFDLYRLSNLEDFFLIGGMDILNDPNSICFIEWPEILMSYIHPTVSIHLEKTSEKERKITIHRFGISKE